MKFGIRASSYRNYSLARILLAIMMLCWEMYPHTAEAQHQLDDFLTIAHQQSPLLNDYNNQLVAAQLDSLLIRAAHRPFISANGMLMYAPAIHGYGYDQAITNGGQYMAVASVSQPIFTRQILQPQYEQLQLQQQWIRNQQSISTYDLDKSVSLQYLNAYADQLLLTHHKQIQDLLTQQQALVQKFVQQGIYQYPDYLNVTVALQNEQITIDQLQSQYHHDLALLRYLCGIHDTSIIQLQEPDITLHHLPPQSSVFLQTYIIDSLLIANQRQIVATKYLPSVNWFADAGWNTSQLSSTAYKNIGASFGISLSVPIYDGHQRKLQYEKLHVQENTRAQYAHFFRNQYAQQLSDLYQQLREVEQRIFSIQQKLATTEELIEIDKKLLQTGNVRITDYILAVQQHVQIQNSLDQARIQRWQILVQLNYWLH
ncbi:MAG: TolC family protein [Thermoflavifilum sp.]|nr:TolC family protein [Thermoflavifilum sp.]